MSAATTCAGSRQCHNRLVKLGWLVGACGLGALAYVFVLPSSPVQQLEHESRKTGTGSDATPSSSSTAIPAPDLDGAHLTIELTNGFETHYMGTLSPASSDRDFSQRVEALSSGDAHYDPWLARAAREIAVQGAILGASPPEPVLSFLLRSSGAPESSVAQMLVQVSGDSADAIDKAILSALEVAPQGAGELLVGVGEVATESGSYDRRLVVVSARRNYEIALTTRQLELGGTWNISGRAPIGFHGAVASVLYPDHEIVVLPIDLEGRRFEFDVPAGDVQGTLRVSIDGVLAEGPGKLLQLQAEVGRPLPSQFEVLLPSPKHFDDVEQAEQYALERLNLDRKAQALPPLIWDASLSDVARSHSRDMRDQEFFSHQSPSTGLAGDRMRRAEYAATSHGENLAFNDSIDEAQTSLMESVGHRRNLVSDSFTHVGVGLARSAGPSDSIAWHLTQLFARKVQPLDTRAVAEELFQAMNEARLQRGQEPLVLSEKLVGLAQMGCERGLHAELEDVPASIAPEAGRIAQSRVSVSAHAFYDLATLETADLGSDGAYARVGLALLRDPESLQGRTLLVIVLAE